MRTVSGVQLEAKRMTQWFSLSNNVMRVLN